MTSKEAREQLGISASTIWDYSQRGLLTPVYLLGKGRGKPTHYNREEVRPLSESRIPELRTFQYRLRAWAKRLNGK
jgi:predicted site-specific integrase-resolvase